MAEAKSNTVVELTPDGGLTKEIIKEGAGDEMPPKNSEVIVHYVGTLLDGTQFDSSRDRDSKFDFKLGVGSVIKGWDLGVASMKRGEVCKLTCRSDYAYGDAGKPPTIPEKATLVFEVELFDWSEEKITTDGLITKVKSISDGEGVLKPNDGATCEVKFSGSLASGAVFSPEQEKTIIIGEDEHIPYGLNTILKHMTKGQKSVFRIRPSEHHYDDREMPDGVTAQDELLLEVELLNFVKQKESWEMNVAEKLEHGTLCKTRGNEQFKKQRFSQAAKKYELGVSTLESTPDEASEDEEKKMNEVLAACWNNLANIQLKEKKFQDAVANCTKVLGRDASNVKALYRRSVARFKMGRNEESLADIKAARVLDKGNKLFIAHMKTVKDCVAANRSKEKAMYQKMFAKPKKSETEPAPARMVEVETEAQTTESSS